MAAKVFVRVCAQIVVSECLSRMGKAQTSRAAVYLVVYIDLHCGVWAKIYPTLFHAAHVTCMWCHLGGDGHVLLSPDIAYQEGLWGSTVNNALTRLYCSWST